MPRFALVICAVLAINCGDNREIREACVSADECLPPTARCEGETTLVEYVDGTCEGGCQFSEKRTDCAATFQVCASGKCVAPDDPCAGTQCETPPDATCTGTMSTTYADAGSCDSWSGTATCHYAATTVNCAATNGACNAMTGLCTAPCDTVTCTTPPAASCTGSMSTSYAATGTCSGTSGTATCSYAATTVNCATTNGACNATTGLCTTPCVGVTCTTPPAASCVGAISITYAPTGTCDGTSGTATCGYAVTNTNCALAGQTCDLATGLCANIDPCAGVTCTTPPAPTCIGNVSSTAAPTGTCVPNAGIGECHYNGTLTDCTLTGNTCDGATGLCTTTNACTGVTCTTPPAASCTGSVATSYATTGTCDVATGNCNYTATTTDCALTGQTCDGATGTCTGAIDPCIGVSCTTPPAASCAGDVATTYASPGTCDGTSGSAVCNYTPTTTDCTATSQVCQAGACTTVSTPAPWARTQTEVVTDVPTATVTVLGRIFISGVTDVSAGNDPLGANLVELGVGTGTDPTAYTYATATANATYAGDEATVDEYAGTITVAGTAGATKQYAFRISTDGGANWIYGDIGTQGSRDGFLTPGTLQIAGPFFSEYIEGSSNHKGIEVYNPGSIPFSLNGCSIKQFTNGSTSATNDLTFMTTDSIAPHGVFTFCQTTVGVACNATTPSTSLWNGDDAIELLCDTTVYDIFGQIGFDPGTAWGTGLTSTADHTLLRQCDVFAGDTVGTDAFVPADHWKGYAVDTFTDLGLRTCPLP